MPLPTLLFYEMKVLFMYTYFFTYQDALPADSGFPLFGRIHLLWLTGIALGIFLSVQSISASCRNKASANAERHRTSGFVLYLYTRYYFEHHRHMNARMLPFHLCDLAAFFYLFLQMRALRTGKWTSLAEITLCLFMPGAVFGILFPVWSIYPAFHYMTIHGFVYHALIMLYPWLLFVQKKIQPKPRHIWQPVLLLCCIVPPVYALI